jgi:hypothetical protein
LIYHFLKRNNSTITSMASSINNSSQNKSNYALAVSHVVAELIKAYDAGDTLNLSKLKGTAAKKYKVQGIPRLADILQALPIGYRAKLWPFLQTKPVRTASGVAVVVSVFAVTEEKHKGGCADRRRLYE